MDGPENKDVVLMPSRTVAVLSFLLTERLDLFNHYMICSLGLIKNVKKFARYCSKKKTKIFTTMNNVYYILMARIYLA